MKFRNVIHIIELVFFFFVISHFLFYLFSRDDINSFIFFIVINFFSLSSHRDYHDK